jgi:sugar lactone lactonase YvrE
VGALFTGGGLRWLAYVCGLRAGDDSETIVSFNGTMTPARRWNVDRSEPEVALEAHAELGEGPIWDPTRARLLWVDCINGVVHSLDPQTCVDVTLPIGQQVGCVAWRRSGGLVVAAGRGFGFIDEGSAIFELAALVGPESSSVVLNDGACDVFGRFWAGTASKDGQPTAVLYRLELDGTVTRMVDGVRMSNGIGWSPDNRLMYYVDSRTQGLDVFEFRADEGMLGRRRRFIDIPADLGIPDGLAVDAEGCVWLSLWGPGLVHRYTPGGRLDRVVELPTSHTTSCTFGGAALDVLYITSARAGLTDQQLVEQPHAGAVFAVAPGIAGLSPNGYAGC